MSEVLTIEGLGEIKLEDLAGANLVELKTKASVDAPLRRQIATTVMELADRAKKARNTDKVHDLNYMLGALQWVLSRFEAAAESLSEVKRDEFARELEAECCLAAGMYRQALKLYAKLAEKESRLDFEMGKVAAMRGCGEHDEADKALAALGHKYDKQAEFHYQRGLSHDLKQEYDAAMAEYQKALELDPSHVNSLFRLAYVADLRGDDEQALELYERCAAVRPVRVNALINLGTLLEDAGRYEEAARCFERVLKWNPNHDRAKLFLRDVEASLTMYYDEDLERKQDRQNKVLEIPVTDFELSVRSRNCLEKMGVRNLGDLCRVTEQDLLSFKNFGETSLNEIKAMMASKGLRLGQAVEKEAPKPRTSPFGLRGKSELDAIKGKPLGDLELSVRSRKCMTKLNLVTIGDLCDRSENDLMECKNFGQTSLTEIRTKLAGLGLKLRETE